MKRTAIYLFPTLPTRHVENFYPAAHRLLVGAEFRIALKEKAGLTLGFHYSLPFANHNLVHGKALNSHHEISMLAMHLRLGGIFK